MSMVDGEETNLGGDCEDSSGHSSLGADQWEQEQEVLLCSKHKGNQDEDGGQWR